MRRTLRQKQFWDNWLNHWRISRPSRVREASGEGFHLALRQQLRLGTGTAAALAVRQVRGLIVSNFSRAKSIA
jgi:hypothetical protein